MFTWVEDEGDGGVVQEEDTGQVLVYKGKILQIHPVLLQAGAPEKPLLEQPTSFIEHVYNWVGVFPQTRCINGQLIPIAHLNKADQIYRGSIWQIQLR